MNDDPPGAGVDRTLIVPLLTMTVADRVEHIVISVRNTNAFFAAIQRKAPSAFEPLAALDALMQRGVDFIVVDGLAGAVWGSPTVTIETAICYRPTPANEGRLRDALSALGANVPVECFPSCEYDEVYSRASRVEIAPGLKVLVCSLDDLMRMKRAANRPKDRIELEILAAVKEEREKLGL